MLKLTLYFVAILFILIALKTNIGRKGINFSGERQMIDGKLSLELEIDEGLDGGALHLNDHVDGGSEQQRIDHHIAAAQLCNDAFLPGVGQEMGEIAKGHEGQYILIACTHLLPQLGVKVEEDLPQHAPACHECFLPKENPREAHKMKGEHNGNPLA